MEDLRETWEISWVTSLDLVVKENKIKGKLKNISISPKKMKGKLRELSVTLEDVYEGKMVSIKNSRKRVCDGCEGKGGKNA